MLLLYRMVVFVLMIICTGPDVKADIDADEMQRQVALLNQQEGREYDVDASIAKVMAWASQVKTVENTEDQAGLFSFADPDVTTVRTLKLEGITDYDLPLLGILVKSANLFALSLNSDEITGIEGLLVSGNNLCCFGLQATLNILTPNDFLHAAPMRMLSVTFGEVGMMPLHYFDSCVNLSENSSIGIVLSSLSEAQVA